MARSSTKFVCSSCGFESSKWYGKCPECGNWNTFEEVQIAEIPSSRLGADKGKKYSLTEEELHKRVQKLSAVKTLSQGRISTGFKEFDRVLGGSVEDKKAGIVSGSVILLSGDPGIGKSTILLQLALGLSAQGKTVLYISGEESEHQIKMRAERMIGIKELEKNGLLLLSTTNIDMAQEVIAKIKPNLVIADSVQTLATEQLPSFPGSIPQIRYVTSRLVSIAKGQGIPVFMVGHVTKEGIVAGPQVLAHMVDTVLYLEGESLSGTRILRAFKNRFGDTSEVGIFIMEEKGLIEIQNTENFFLNKNDSTVPGSCVTVTMEGSRPLIVEIQALVVPTTFAYPRRIAQGITDRRLELLLAVIQKHAKIPIERNDVFLNVVGGLKIQETAADLAACLAIISSYKSKSLGQLVAIGEVGLLGELKSIPNLDKRIREAKKFGFSSTATVAEFQNLALASAKLLA